MKKQKGKLFPSISLNPSALEKKSHYTDNAKHAQSIALAHLKRKQVVVLDNNLRELYRKKYKESLRASPRLQQHHQYSGKRKNLKSEPAEINYSFPPPQREDKLLFLSLSRPPISIANKLIHDIGEKNKVQRLRKKQEWCKPSEEDTFWINRINEISLQPSVEKYHRQIHPSKNIKKRHETCRQKKKKTGKLFYPPIRTKQQTQLQGWTQEADDDFFKQILGKKKHILS